ncbi:MAG: hypothetical protein ACRD15_15585 [Vicinamibacterales bacterium]
MPEVDAMFTMSPIPRAVIGGTTRFVTSTRPNTFVSNKGAILTES